MNCNELYTCQVFPIFLIISVIRLLSRFTFVIHRDFSNTLQPLKMPLVSYIDLMEEMCVMHCVLSCNLSLVKSFTKRTIL